MNADGIRCLPNIMLWGLDFVLRRFIFYSFLVMLRIHMNFGMSIIYLSAYGLIQIIILKRGMLW